jgi:two-component system, OmpR family, response regulator
MEHLMRVLCADDEEDIRLVLELALSLDPEINADIVSSGEEAIARARAERYDVILLDGMMPGLDGYETCRRLKSDPLTSDVPVVFLSAKSQLDDRNQAFRVGATASLAKPFDPMTLASQLREALGR